MATAPSALPNRAIAAAVALEHAIDEQPESPAVQPQRHATSPITSLARLQASLSESAFDLNEVVAESSRPAQDTVLYLAYGSNLSVQTFRGMRGIRPLSQINVQVPSLNLVFDLPGIAYAEPCFANSDLRVPSDHAPSADVSSPTPGTKDDKYRKNLWHKGLVGVVYEVTMQDFAHIIATEGGGSSYKDILVDCYPFESSDPTVLVPWEPATTAFKAHTLFAPDLKSAADPAIKAGRLRRSDPAYAQPSARYLKLITDGAAELGLPFEYQEYLRALRPFRVTTLRQRVGQGLYLAIWGPLILGAMKTSSKFADEKGNIPDWMARIVSGLFRGAWVSYDNFFRFAFGDGERTIGDDKLLRSA